jgi:hypothetical protein
MNEPANGRNLGDWRYAFSWDSTDLGVVLAGLGSGPGTLLLGPLPIHFPQCANNGVIDLRRRTLFYYRDTTSEMRC